jgi:hypothetical protein
MLGGSGLDTSTPGAAGFRWRGRRNDCGVAERSPRESLDGSWRLERVSGLLPPLTGVRKRIAGSHGETHLGPLPGVPFDVVGLELHYRWPFTRFVDVLEPAPGGFVGRATVRGWELGRFRMTRLA